MPPHAEEPSLQAISDTSAVVVPDPVLQKKPTYSRFTIDNVLPQRTQAKPLPTGVAAFGNAEMFKSKECLERPKAKSWAYRFSLESRSRQGSSLKHALRHLRPGMISMCGGLPSSDYFPFQQASFQVPVSPFFSDSDSRENGVTKTVGKHDIATQNSSYDLSVALNYGQGMGPPQLLRFLTEHTEIVHHPPYADWEICVTCGSTSALDIALRIFAERGHYIIMEELTFSSALETVKPLGLRPVGIKMDEHGMQAEDLDHVLSTWDEAARGAPKPFLLYTIPTGQNPTASTQTLERRKAIYEVAEKHDLYILEDEPYYFLQMEPYVSGHIHEVPSPFKPVEIPDFLSSLVPSYLSLDTSGRVMRMDSFSKVVAPGARSGWVTAAPQVIERFIMHSGVSVQNPSGWSSMALYKLLDEHWGHRGFLEWLMFLRAEYTRRRDVIVDSCEKYLPREVVHFTAPAAGMFHWITVDPTQHPVWKAKADSVSQADLLAEIDEQIFLSAVQQNVLVARGSWFKAESDKTDSSDGRINLFFRMTFASASEANIVAAVERFGESLRQGFGLNRTSQ